MLSVMMRSFWACEERFPDNTELMVGIAQNIKFWCVDGKRVLLGVPRCQKVRKSRAAVNCHRRRTSGVCVPSLTAEHCSHKLSFVGPTPVVRNYVSDTHRYALLPSTQSTRLWGCDDSGSTQCRFGWLLLSFYNLLVFTTT